MRAAGRPSRHLPSQSLLGQAWDDGGIDGAFCWGAAYNHMRADESTVVLDAGLLQRWGKETFVVMAVTNSFVAAHPAVVQKVAQVWLTHYPDSPRPPTHTVPSLPTHLGRLEPS